MDLKPRLLRLPRRLRSRGFTHLELVTTIAVASLMSASVVPKMIPQASRSAANWQAIRLADDLRHARLLAMSLGKALAFNTPSARTNGLIACNGDLHDALIGPLAGADPHAASQSVGKEATGDDLDDIFF